MPLLGLIQTEDDVEPMKRRQIIFGSVQHCLASGLRWTVPSALVGIVRQASGQSALSAPRALPSSDQIAWQNLELGMFVHFAPNTWQDVESDNLSTPLSEIDPKRLDTDHGRRPRSLCTWYFVDRCQFFFPALQATDRLAEFTLEHSGKSSLNR